MSRLKQLDVHHAHLVQNDHIALEQVFIVVDKADHAAGIVHLQQTVDGAGLAPGQFAETLGGTASGSITGLPGLIFQQLQNGVDRVVVCGAGAAGEHKVVLCHSLADGFPLQRSVGVPRPSKILTFYLLRAVFCRVLASRFSRSAMSCSAARRSAGG